MYVYVYFYAAVLEASSMSDTLSPRRGEWEGTFGSPPLEPTPDPLGVAGLEPAGILPIAKSILVEWGFELHPHWAKYYRYGEYASYEADSYY